MLSLNSEQFFAVNDFVRVHDSSNPLEYEDNFYGFLKEITNHWFRVKVVQPTDIGTEKFEVNSYNIEPYEFGEFIKNISIHLDIDDVASILIGENPNPDFPTAALLRVIQVENSFLLETILVEMSNYFENRFKQE